MADEDYDWKKFKLTPGQQPPNDGWATGIAFDGDWICWRVLTTESASFNPTNPGDSTQLTNDDMTWSDTTAFHAAVLESETPPE